MRRQPNEWLIFDSIKYEQTHIRRLDYIIKPVVFLTVIWHWFNPIIWISFILMTRDMEMSCDESVIKHSGEDIRANYANSLLSLSVKQGLISPLAFGRENNKLVIDNAHAGRILKRRASFVPLRAPFYTTFR